jgi:hypothetical protein
VDTINLRLPALRNLVGKSVRHGLQVALMLALNWPVPGHPASVVHAAAGTWPAARSSAATTTASSRTTAHRTRSRHRHGRTEADTATVRPQPVEVPAALVQIDASQRHVLIADAAVRRLSVWRQEAGGWRALRSMPMSLGAGGLGKHREGDQRTPLGFYRVVGLRRAPALPPDFGPLALVLNYPNELDRALGRSGSDIWVHGGPGAPQAPAKSSSSGCIVLRNADLLSLQRLLGNERPGVLVTPALRLATTAEVAADRRAVRGWLSAWQRASLRGKIDSLRRLYGPDAFTDGPIWPVPVVVEEVSIVDAGSGTWVLSFNAGDGVAQRHYVQYWQRADGQWRIVAEGVSG